MVHTFECLGVLAAVDVGSGAVHILSREAFDLLNAFIATGETVPPERFILSVYPPEVEKDAWDAVYNLYKQGSLFAPETAVTPPTVTPLKALCLHVAHDCNLRCAYCFADTGRFGAERGLMDRKTAIAAIDYLVSRSGNRRNLEVDFFGGEPLLALDTVKATVEYARSIEKKYNKNFRFTLTTNGVLLDDDTIDYLNREMSNVVLSLDGERELNDAHRPAINGRGSYDAIVPRYQKFAAKREGDYYVRGTFTAKNPQFTRDLLHLADLGFKNLSMEPVVLGGDHALALTEEHLPTLLKEYEKLAEIIKNRKDFQFFHFNIDLKQGPCVYKRLRGCGAGFEYAAVTPDGGVYPCHQFAGREEYKMGDVFAGDFDPAISRKFSSVDVNTREKCRSCWAKFYCSGGCFAANLNTNGDINSVYELGCKLMKKRIECAIALKAQN